MLELKVEKTEDDIFVDDEVEVEEKKEEEVKKEVERVEEKIEEKVEEKKEEEKPATVPEEKEEKPPEPEEKTKKEKKERKKRERKSKKKEDIMGFLRESKNIVKEAEERPAEKKKVKPPEQTEVELVPQKKKAGVKDRFKNLISWLPIIIGGVLLLIFFMVFWGRKGKARKEPENRVIVIQENQSEPVEEKKKSVDYVEI